MLGAPILGDKENISCVTSSMVREFHRRYYNAKNMCIVATGNIDTDKFRQLAKKYFTFIPNMPNKNPIEQPNAKYYQNMCVIRDDSKEFSNVAVFYEAPSWRHEDYFAFTFFERLFGNYTSDSTTTYAFEHITHIFN